MAKSPSPLPTPNRSLYSPHTQARELPVNRPPAILPPHTRPHYPISLPRHTELNEVYIPKTGTIPKQHTTTYPMTSNYSVDYPSNWHQNLTMTSQPMTIIEQNTNPVNLHHPTSMVKKPRKVLTHGSIEKQYNNNKIATCVAKEARNSQIKCWELCSAVDKPNDGRQMEETATTMEEQTGAENAQLNKDYNCYQSRAYNTEEHITEFEKSIRSWDSHIHVLKKDNDDLKDDDSELHTTSPSYSPSTSTEQSESPIGFVISPTEAAPFMTSTSSRDPHENSNIPLPKRRRPPTEPNMFVSFASRNSIILGVVYLSESNTVLLRSIRGRRMILSREPEIDKSAMASIRIAYFITAVEVVLTPSYYANFLHENAILTAFPILVPSQYPRDPHNLTMDDMARFFASQGLAVEDIHDAALFAYVWLRDIKAVNVDILNLVFQLRY
ncbi:hypothetical protein C8R42DRAFT_648997 [Lentinula raphanica]|nr:hypothetical protein C8R42DRAFT_648997 [Lentinula raphanica]